MNGFTAWPGKHCPGTTERAAEGRRKGWK